MRVCVFWILRILNSWDLPISGLLDFWVLDLQVLKILRLSDLGSFGFRDSRNLVFWGFWDVGFFGLSSDLPIPEVGFFDFYLYSGGRLVDPAMRSRCLLRRLRSREASADSRDGSRRRQLLNR